MRSSAPCFARATMSHQSALYAAGMTSRFECDNYLVNHESHIHRFDCPNSLHDRWRIAPKAAYLLRFPALVKLSHLAGLIPKQPERQKPETRGQRVSESWRLPVARELAKQSNIQYRWFLLPQPFVVLRQRRKRTAKGRRESSLHLPRMIFYISKLVCLR